MLRNVQLFAIPWTSPWNSPGQNTGVGSLSLLQGILLTQGLNPGLLHCRGILYWLSHKGSPVVKNQPANFGDIRDRSSIPGLGRFPGGGHGNSRLENPMDRGAWWATVHGVAKSQTPLKQLSMDACTIPSYDVPLTSCLFIHLMKDILVILSLW